MKPFPRVLTISSKKFSFTDKKIPAIIVSVKTPSIIMNLEKIIITKDGDDANFKLIEKIKEQNLPHDIIMLKGITIAGLNYLDPFLLNSVLSRPVIIVFEKKKKNALTEILYKVPHGNNIKSVLEKLSDPIALQTNYGRIFINYVGIKQSFVKGLVKKLTIISKWPEPIRIAKKISSIL